VKSISGTWNRIVNRLIWKGHDEESEVNGIAFTPDGKRVVTAASDGEIRIWDAANGKDLGKIVGPKEGIIAMALSPDGRRALIAGGNGFACVLYDLETKKEILRLVGHTANVNSLVFSPDGKQILTGSADRTLRLWDATAGRSCAKSMRTPAMSRASNSPPMVWGAASVGYDHVNRLWGLERRPTRRLFRSAQPAGALRCDFSRRQDYLLRRSG